MDVYEQRIIVYADILGWSNACNDMARFPSLKKAADKRNVLSASLESYGNIPERGKRRLKMLDDFLGQYIR